MDRKQKGFTLIEILVVVTIIGVLAGLVVVLIPKGKEKANQLDCTNNVKQLCGTLITLGGSTLPSHGGVNLMLYLYAKGELKREEDNLKLLFCPGDLNERWKDTGGVAVYEKVDISKEGEYGNLSSYAGRINDRKCAANLADTAAQAIICDDSEDHHLGKGFVVGYTNSSAKFRDKLDDWKIDIATVVKVGEGSEVPELQCLSTE